MESSDSLSNSANGTLANDWKVLEEEFIRLEQSRLHYRKQIDEISKARYQHSKALKNYKKSLATFESKLKKNSNSIATTKSFQSLSNDIVDRRIKMDEMVSQLPTTNNGMYLNIILGGINVSLTDKQDKFSYKDEYEKFKMTITLICMVMATFALCFHFRVLDALFHFLLVWYYCTLTIRESILRCNGSRIKGWWLAHHYFSAILCGILLTWPDGACYQSFRSQFLIFSLYLSVVQLIQCQYQRGCLYRLRSLGDTHSMAITIDGFHSWMFRGLSFVLPFLLIGYFGQLYNAYTLYYIWSQDNCTSQWQVLAASILFLFLALNNTLTTATVCYKKWAETKKVDHSRRLRQKYSVDNGGSRPNLTRESGEKVE